MSISRKLALLGRPIRGPVSASTSSTVKSPSSVSWATFAPKKQPMRLPMKLGVSLQRHHAFAEVQIAELRDPVQHFAACVSAPGDDLRQVQVARRIEEVGAQKMLPELAVETLGDLRQWNAAGVGGDNRAGRAQRRHAAPEGTLDLQILGHGFDDPFAAPDAAQIVLEIAGGDQGFGGVGEERHGPLLGGAFDSGQRRRIPLGLVGQHDIQQVHREPGVGKMGRDARTHGSRSQNRNTA